MSDCFDHAGDAGAIPLGMHHTTHTDTEGEVKPKFVKPDYDRLIDCAAIKLPNGEVWTGKRHCHCFATIMQAKGAPAHTFGLYVQGFVTMSGKFLDRDEAYALVLETGQVKPTRKELYSEDLY